MKNTVILFMLLFTISCGTNKTVSPEEQAKLKATKDFYTDLFEKKSFVLEANTVYSEKRESFQMNPIINFIKLEKGKGVVQLAFNNITGWNGVGGITLSGRVRNYEIIKKEGNKLPSIKFEMVGNRGWSTIRLSVNASGYATASVDSMRGRRITFSGSLVTLEESDIFRGMSRF